MVGATEVERLVPHLPTLLQWAQPPLTFFPVSLPKLYFAHCVFHILSGILTNIRPWPPQHFCRQTVRNTKQAIQSLSVQVTKFVILIRACTRGTKQVSNQCLVCEYTVSVSVRGLRKFYVTGSSVCIWTTLIFPENGTVTDRTMPYVV